MRAMLSKNKADWFYTLFFKLLNIYCCEELRFITSIFIFRHSGWIPTGVWKWETNQNLAWYETK